MSNANLVTQGEVKNITDSLGALSDNLNDHINASMSKSHGWTGITQTYQDSGGSYHSGVEGPPTVQHEVRLTVGDKVFYAPAQMNGGLKIDNQLATYDDLVLPIFTGSVSPQQADPALDITIGSPSPSALTTSFAIAQGAVASKANSMLSDHAGSPAESTHSGLSSRDLIVHDSAGHVVGRKGVNLTFKHARWLNIPNWTIVCDSDDGGPPQIPHLTSLCPSVTVVSGSGGNTSISPESCLVSNDWSDYAPLLRCAIGLEVSGTPPILFEWQWSYDGYTWSSVDSLNGGSLAQGSFTFNFTLAGNEGGFALTGGSGTLYAVPPIKSSIYIAGSADCSNDGSAKPLCFVRCKFDNTSVIGGAVTYSNGLQINESRRA